MSRTRQKAKNGAGTVEPRRDASGVVVWWVRVALPRVRGQKLQRKRVPIPNSERMTETQARREGAKIAKDVKEGRIVFDEKPRSGAKPATPGALLTVKQLGEQWTKGELFEKYGNVNRLRVKATADIDAWTMAKHVYGVKTRGAGGATFGDLRVVDVTNDDIAAVMASHSSKLAAQTRMHTYQRLRRLFDLAIFPLRIRKENPVERYVRPERDAEKLFCFLYPSEFLALLANRKPDGESAGIPLGRRVLYAIATYTGQRKGSLFALRWKHADFDHGTLASFKTKTKRAQYFVADRGLMTILEAWRAHCRAIDEAAAEEDEEVSEPSDDDEAPREDDEPIVRGVDYDPKRLATALRDDLKAVGVTRSILFEEDADNVQPLRFHDMRSTFCSWARRAQKSDAWISERTGHDLDGDMINRYDRGAQTLGDLGYEPFPDIARALPDLPPLPRLASALAKVPAGDEKAESNAATESETLPTTCESKQAVGARGFEPPTPRSRTECATRLRYAPENNSSRV